MASTTRVSGMVSGIDTESVVQAYVQSYVDKKNKVQQSQTKLSYKQDAWKELNTKVYSLYSKMGSLKFSTAYNLKKTTISDSTKASVSASSGAVIGTQTLEINELAKAGYLTGGKLASGTTEDTTLSELGYSDGDTTISVSVGSGDATEISISGDSTISDVITALKNAGVNASFDENNGRIFINAKDSGADNDFTLSADSTEGNSVLSALGLVVSDDEDDTEGAKRVYGQDAEIILNGATYTSSTSNFSINGLNISALAQTDGEISISTTQDSQGIYDKVKDFLSTYNELINEMQSLYNADSAKGYEPLTDDQKEEMSEKEIEKWEDKIKDSILRRDSSLGTLINKMTSSMASPITVNDTSYSLSDFGIQTLGYLNAAKNEQYAYHIYGDADDSDVSTKEDKLMSMITSDPDTVIEYMQKLSSNLYDAIGNEMKSTNLRSAYTVYNDKQMSKEYTAYTKSIKEWESKIADMEDRYYAKFAAMESTLAKLQNSTSSISSLLGS